MSERRFESATHESTVGSTLKQRYTFTTEQPLLYINLIVIRVEQVETQQ